MQTLKKTAARDFSKANGKNATKTIEQHYELLMSHEDPETLAQDVLALVTSDGGISATNLMKLRLNLDRTRGDLTRLRSFVTNFMLSGSGMSTSQFDRN